MSPKARVTLLLLGLAFPYLVFVLYFILTAIPGSENPFPSWFPWVALTYMLSGIVAASVLGPRIFRNAPPPPQAQARRAFTIAKGWSLYLVLVWSGFFLYGGYRTLKGDFPLERALPAGAFLLAFIGIFAWSLRRMNAASKQAKSSVLPDR
jgi:hypothetical protein